jgi:hypothetical protein
MHSSLNLLDERARGGIKDRFSRLGKTIAMSPYAIKAGLSDRQ